MSVTVDAVTSPADGAPPREWYQVLGQRRAEWLARHPTVARRVAWVRTVVAWSALGYLAVMLWVMPELRVSTAAWLGACWVVVAWFFLARTKTLTWSGLLRFFSVCAVWSVVIGVTLRVLSADLGGFGGVGKGAPTIVAGIGEEALKLVPVLLLLVLAPRRFARLAAVDFVLLGLASGAAFQGVEEAVRRMRWANPHYEAALSPTDRLVASGVPVDFTSFGVWPVPSEMVTWRSWSDPVVSSGHAVVTGLVVGVVGLAVVACRAVRRRSVPVRVAGWCGAVVVAVVVLVTMMSDHLAANARSSTGDAWSQPGSTVPWWLQVPWRWFGHGHYRPAALVVLVVVCLAVDGFRLAARPGTNLVPGPVWAPVAWAGTRLPAWHSRARWPGRVGANAVNGLLAAVWITSRDLAQQVAA